MSVSVGRAQRASSVLLAAVLGAAVFGGTASAYWRTTGTGSSTATTGTLIFTVDAVPAAALQSAGTTTAGSLIPDGRATALLRVSNSSELPVTITAISAGSSASVNGCAAGTVTLTPPASYADASFRIEKGSSSTVQLPNALHMSASAVQACMGQSFSLQVTVTVQSA
jgi:hypothetical protein